MTSLLQARAITKNQIATALQQSAGTVLEIAMHAPRFTPHHRARRVLFQLAVFGLLVCPLTSHADIYVFEAEDGSTHYSDSADDPRYRLLIRDDKPSADNDLSAGFKPRGVRGFENEIAAVARTSQVEAALLHAVIAVESNYNPRAVSPKGALGLMQLMPATARAYGIKNPLDALQNIQGGAQHLRKLLDYFANDMSLALAAYNAGLGAVIRHGGQIPPFAETLNYVPAVLRRYASNRLIAPTVNEEVSAVQSALTDKQ
jgi:soluble lytic murein transglycosylase-like protein